LEGVVGRRNRPGTQPRTLLLEADGGNRADGPRGAPGVDVDQPLLELLREVGPILEAAALEEAARGSADEILRRPSAGPPAASRVRGRSDSRAPLARRPDSRRSNLSSGRPRRAWDCPGPPRAARRRRPRTPAAVRG